MSKATMSLLLTIVAIFTLSCSSSGEESSYVPINLPRDPSVVAYSDNKYIESRSMYDVDSYSPCTIYYLVATSSNSVGVDVRKIEISLDGCAWEDVTAHHLAWLAGQESIHLLEPDQLLQVTFTEPGSHWFNCRVVYADGVVIDTSTRDHPDLEFTVYPSNESSI